jgi:pimeloyl-ACP methyl ester carboxylesterase
MQPRTQLLVHTDVGTGSPALLHLPGWCGGREGFAPLLARTASSHRSISIDWRGHGESAPAQGDFGAADSVADAVALLDELGVGQVVPVALAHAGWIALELRRILGARRVPGVVLLDWMPLGSPPGFADALAGLQDPHTWQDVRAQLFAMWSAGVDDVAVHAYIESMGSYGFDMWSRAGREISQAFQKRPVPLDACAELSDCPTLHLYAQPRDDGYLAAQQVYAAEHPWFRVQRLDATSHFPCLEVPDQVAAAIAGFARNLQ